MDIGTRIKQLRGKESRKSFCDRLGIAQRTLIRYENGERRPDSDFIEMICKAYNVTADWLIFGEQDNHQKTTTNQQPDIIKNLNTTKPTTTPMLIEQEEAPATQELLEAYRTIFALQKEVEALKTKVTEIEAAKNDFERNLMKELVQRKVRDARNALDNARREVLKRAAERTLDDLELEEDAPESPGDYPRIKVGATK